MRAGGWRPAGLLLGCVLLALTPGCAGWGVGGGQGDASRTLYPRSYLDDMSPGNREYQEGRMQRY